MAFGRKDDKQGFLVIVTGVTTSPESGRAELSLTQSLNG